MARRRLDEIGTGLGPAATPFSQVPQEDPLMGMLDPNKQAEAIRMMQGGGAGGGMPPAEEEGMMDPNEPGSLPGEDEEMGMGGEVMPPVTSGAPMEEGAPDSSAIPTDALQGMVSQNMDPDVARIMQALEDPNTDPRVIEQIQLMTAMAARRRMAGIQV